MSNNAPTARTRAKRARTRAEIVAATRAEVRASGIERMSLDAIAGAVNLTKPALYYYFASREALIFELLLVEWTRAAKVVAAAVERTETGDEALKALVQTYIEHYSGDLGLFDLTHHQLKRLDSTSIIGEAELERIRPINDLFLAGVEERLRADVARGATSVDDPRRVAFAAMSAAIGFLTMKSMVESVGDPLKHTDQDVVQTLASVFQAGITRPK